MSVDFDLLGVFVAEGGGSWRGVPDALLLHGSEVCEGFVFPFFFLCLGPEVFPKDSKVFLHVRELFLCGFPVDFYDWVVGGYTVLEEEG